MADLNLHITQFPQGCQVGTHLSLILDPLRISEWKKNFVGNSNARSAEKTAFHCRTRSMTQQSILHLVVNWEVFIINL